LTGSGKFSDFRPLKSSSFAKTMMDRTFFYCPSQQVTADFVTACNFSNHSYRILNRFYSLKETQLKISSGDEADKSSTL